MLQNFNGPHMNKKLLIWDFDGVISDTEKLWLYNRMCTINEAFGLNWTEDQTHQTLLGMSDKTKREVLDALGLVTDDAFWAKNKELDYQIMRTNGLSPTEGILDIFQISALKQCIATGGLKEKTALKIELSGLEKYFPPEHVFTADMVQRGKPEPDLFLLAAAQMGEKPENSIVIEDSLAGLTAAIRAGIMPVAFTGCVHLNKEAYTKQIRALGVVHIFDNMSELKNFILTQI